MLLQNLVSRNRKQYFKGLWHLQAKSIITIIIIIIYFF